VAVTVVPEVALSPVAGDQVYVVAPLALSETELPAHIEGADGETLTVSAGTTVTVTVPVFVQPAADVPVMV
jgi:hypothetical protein